MNEKDARELFETIVAELRAQGLGLPSGWILRFDHSKRRFGQCSYSRRRISLSRALVALNGPEKVGGTIRHEIAHALVGPGHGHDWVWKRMAVRCGDDGKRCYSADVVTPEAPWTATCPKCKQVFKRHRAPKADRTSWCKCLHSANPPTEMRLSFTSTTPASFPPTTPATVPSGTGAENIKRVLALRASGLGYVAIDAAFGIHGKHGWWSWKIVKEHS
jgi:predicted SprT family Zn-dependent metalloprotease